MMRHNPHHLNTVSCSFSYLWLWWCAVTPAPHSWISILAAADDYGYQREGSQWPPLPPVRWPLDQTPRASCIIKVCHEGLTRASCTHPRPTIPCNTAYGLSYFTMQCLTTLIQCFLPLYKIYMNLALWLFEDMVCNKLYIHKKHHKTNTGDSLPI